MRKFLRRVFVIGLSVAMFWCGTCLADRQKLSEEIIRLHVVGASDSQADQAVKLQVRDAVLEKLRQGTAQMTSMEQARAYIQNHLSELQKAGNQVLKQAGFTETCTVTLTRENFPTREYDTFSLPEGIYESLRVTIGEGQGKNWWCVVFPELCIPATVADFEDVAAASGFPDSLTGALTGEVPYQIRFFFLECLGKLENFLQSL